MINKLRELNPELKIFTIHDEEFKKYGRVIDFNAGEIVSACERIERPKEGSEYRAACEELESLECSPTIKELIAGGCEAQIGICHGYSRKMNGLEYHKSSEINIAATNLVLLLGLEYEMEGEEYFSDKIKAFYLEKGDTVEIYSTSLHFCPCQVSDSGFSCVVGLPSGTNLMLDKPSEDKLLFKKNKWLICHDENAALIEKGVYPGLHGENYEIKYQENRED